MKNTYPLVARERVILLLALAIFTLLGACAGPTPEVSYKDVSKTLDPPAGDTSEPPVPPLKESQIVYALRTTDLTIFPSTYKSGDSALGTPQVDVCAASSTASAAQKKAKADAIKADSRDCFTSAIAVATPASIKQNVYVLTPSQPFQVKVQLSSTPITSDPLLSTAITVTYTDNRKQYFTNIGAAAAAGFALGPAGAIAGGVLAATLPLVGAQGLTALPAQRPLYLNLICPDDVYSWDTTKASLSSPIETKLVLPVTLSLTNPGTPITQDPLLVDKDPKNCWHPLPASPSGWKVANGADPADPKHKAALTTGWLYRFVAMGPAPTQFGGEKLTDFFGAIPQEDANSKDPGDTAFAVTTTTSLLPVTPCQTAGVEFIWYVNAEEQLEAAKLPANPKVDDVLKVPLAYAVSPPVQVANPLYVQPLTLPKGGSINFGAVCGASVSYTNTAGTLDQNAEALISDVNAIKQAQLSYKKTK